MVRLVTVFGVGVDFQTENSNNVVTQIGTVEASLTTVTSGQEDSQILFKTIASGTVKSAVAMDATGLDIKESAGVYKINGKTLLSGTALGADVTSSSLTSVGTLTSLTVNGAVTIADGGNDIDIKSHDGTNGLKLAGVLVTATAAELNVMDGVTVTKDDLNKMDGAQKGTVVNGKPVVYSDAGQIKATTLDITKDDASNNNVLYIMTVQRLTSGTPGNGIGVGVDFQTENSNNVVTQIGTVEASLTTVTSGQEESNLLHCK